MSSTIESGKTDAEPACCRATRLSSVVTPDTITLRVVDWDESKAWSNFHRYHPKDLERRVVSSTGQRPGVAKELVRRLKRREQVTLELAKVKDELGAQSLRSFLESVGAIVEVSNA